MAIYEDPMFVKALKLLHSTAKDSTLQMRHLLQEAIDQKYGVGTKTLNLKLHTQVEEASGSARGSRGASPAVLVISEKSSRSSTPPSEPVSIRTSPEQDDADFALEMFNDDLLCTVCKGMRVTSDNRLLECDGCRSLYHQECHKPPVDSDTISSTNVWNCDECSRKKHDKTSSKSKSESSRKYKTDSDHSDSSSKRRDVEVDASSKKHHKSDKDKDAMKKSSKSSSSSKSIGSSKSSRSEHRSSSSSSGNKSSSSSLNFNKQPDSPNSKSPACTANIIAADKRIQNMKKKAAAKMQEKRK